MEVTGEQHFKAPRSLVYELMLDPKAIQQAIPGCEVFTDKGDESYDMTVKVGMAAIKGTYSGNVKVRDAKADESYRLVVGGSGKPGSVQGDATMTLIDHMGGTLVKYHGEIKAQGAIARLGSRLLGGAAKLMIGQFMKGMEKQVQDRVA